tara:strand:+ start:1291 stop:1737 length:447 start_codon:yes stop_codon:yes gene_type:complete
MNKNIVIEFLNSWTEGVIEIGKVYQKGGDFKAIAGIFIEKHYAFSEANVLFKPTFTSEKVFRNNKADAISYFIKGNISEDKGFALKPWETIELDELNFLLDDNFIASMGTFLFKPLNEDEVTKVAFTFIFTKINNSLKIKVHHSSPVF